MIQRVPEELNDDLPPLTQGTTATEYVNERTRIEDGDVVQGLRELDGAEGVRWKIARVGSEDPSRDGELAEWPTETLTTENIARRFGPGTYKIFGRYPNGTYAAQRRVKIAPDAVAVQRAANATSATAVGGHPSGLSWEQWEAREDARRERARKERNELLAIAIPAVAPIVAAMIGNRGPDLASLIMALKPPPAPTLPEMMQGLASLKALAPEQTTDPIDRALKLLDIIQDKAPTGGETGWLDIVKEVVRAAGPQVIGPALQSAMSRQSSPALPHTVAPASPALSLPSSGPTPENPQMLELLGHLPWLKAQLTMALGKAARGSDPGLIAVRIVDDLPDGVDPTWIATLIARADWFEQLQKLEPQVTPFREWFTHMREAMLTEFSPPPAAPEQPQMSVTMHSDEVDMPKGPPSLTGE